MAVGDFGALVVGHFPSTLAGLGGTIDGVGRGGERAEVRRRLDPMPRGDSRTEPASGSPQPNERGDRERRPDSCHPSITPEYRLLHFFCTALPRWLARFLASLP